MSSIDFFRLYISTVNPIHIDILVYPFKTVSYLFIFVKLYCHLLQHLVTSIKLMQFVTIELILGQYFWYILVHQNIILILNQPIYLFLSNQVLPIPSYLIIRSTRTCPIELTLFYLELPLSPILTARLTMFPRTLVPVLITTLFIVVWISIQSISIHNMFP